jgi:alpha-L-arabinofuranosidase
VSDVDDIIATGSEASAIEQIKSNMSKAFDRIDLVLLHYYPDVEIWQIGSNIFVSKTKYVKSLHDKFK